MRRRNTRSSATARRCNSNSVSPKNFEVSLFHGFKSREEIVGAEFNFFASGPHLLTLGAVNWSSQGGGTQPVLEYGYYAKDDHFIAGAIYAGKRAEAVLGYSHQLTEKLLFSADCSRAREILSRSASPTTSPKIFRRTLRSISRTRARTTPSATSS